MSDAPRSRVPEKSGAFPKSEPLRRAPETTRAGLEDLSVEDLHEIKLLIRGESVVDWHRLHLETPEDARRLLALNALDIEDAEDVARIEQLRAQAADYVANTLKLRLDEEVVRGLPFLELFLLASGEGRLRRQACVMLKVMHIMYHLDARELRTRLPVSDNELFALVEESVVAMFDELRAAGVPVSEFSWSRKTRDSLITKLLVKKQTSAARIFDRLRFRVVVERPDDLLSTLHVMLHRCIPFNYVVPGQTVNNLLTPASVDRVQRILEEEEEDPDPEGPAEPSSSNEFSSKRYRVLNFIADLPVRVDDIVDAADREDTRGNVVFVLAEFQVMDAVTARENETGESAHIHYKNRQHSRVKERLLREPGKKSQG